MLARPLIERLDMMRRSTLCSLALIAFLLPTVPAHADGGGGSGGGISGPGDEVPAVIQSQDKQKQAVADAYLRAKYDEGSSSVLANVTRAYASRYPKALGGRLTSVATRGRASAERPAVARAPFAISKLAMTQRPQSKNFYCGPATGQMLLQYRNEGASALTGVSLTQAHVADANHMRTDVNGKTAWDTGLFRIGLNKWRVGSSIGYYVDKDSPTPAEFRSNLVYDTDNNFPIAASTVEFGGQAHYNHHPRDKTIGHWIAGQGYFSYGGGVYFLDPATSVWGGVHASFTAASGDFATTYLHTNGITW